MAASSRTAHAVVIGAGIGGLVSALSLASQGARVTVVESAPQPGGKLRMAKVAGSPIDCGPTVLTMRGVFDAVFAEAGTNLDSHLRLTPADVLARHAWQDDAARLDLYADHERTVDAIGVFAGAAEARRYRGFCVAARRLFDTLDAPFMRVDKPDVLRLIGPATRAGPGFARIPFTSLWRALGRHFADPRLRQLFARYATYCGSSPFASPATLMLVAHVERSGVWLVEGGMYRLASVLTDLARERGVTFHFGLEARGIRVERGRVQAVELAGRERIEADAVICNADCAALAAGLFGDQVRDAAPSTRVSQRSLSAITLALRADPRGFPLARHSVFFSTDYEAEFQDLARGRVPSEPTVYVCAQDRDAAGMSDPAASPERLFCIINAPPVGDSHTFDAPEIAQCEARTFRALQRCGLALHSVAGPIDTTTPNDFHRRYPATGGALYGAASHGWRASFRRSGVRSRIPGLYLCGGSIHPGPGLPMAALSGQMAARALLKDLASIRRSRPAAMLGGMSTA